MSSEVKEGKKEKEVTPEAFLERLKNVTTPDDIFEFFEDLWSLVMDTMNKANADAGAKAQATLFMGLLSGRFYILLDAYKVALDYDFIYKDDLHDKIEDVLKKLIEVYDYLKKGGSLRKATDTIAWTSISAEHSVKDFMYHLARTIDDLSPRPYW